MIATDPDTLPPAVFLKHGAYYLVKRKRWIRLTKQRDNVWEAYRRVAEADFRDELGRSEIAAYLQRTLARSRNNAMGRRGIPHDLTLDEAVDLLQVAGWRCAVTGTPFTLEIVGPRNQRPFAPSIDRIDNALGYSRSNCRIVCAAANIAMNTWGEQVLLKLARHAHEKMRLEF